MNMKSDYEMYQSVLSKREEFRRRKKNFRSDANGFVGEEQIQGTERYHCSRLHYFSNITAVTLSLTIVVGGLVYALHSFAQPQNDMQVTSDATLSAETTIEEVTETPTEPAYLELTEDDFTPVDIMCEITDGTPSEVHCIELEGIDFGERMSPCKAFDVYEDYLRPFNIWDDPDNPGKYEKYFHTMLETPFKGQVDSAVYLDGKLFFAVNFDDYCSCHDSSVFRYDPATKETKELVRHESLEYNCSFASLNAVHGKLLFVKTIETDIKHYVVNEIDAGSGEISELFSVDVPIYDIHESADGLLIGSYNGESIQYLQEYVFATKELRDFENKNAINSKRTFFCDGIPAEITGGFDGYNNVPITVKTQYYSISTDINNYSNIFIWRDKLCIVPADNFNGSWLYTYDIAKRECLKMKFDGFKASLIKTNDALVCLSYCDVGDDSNTTLYYIEPTLGTVFRVGKVDGRVMAGGSENDAFALTLKSADGKKLNELSYGMRYSGTTIQANLPNKFFTFD